MVLRTFGWNTWAFLTFTESVQKEVLKTYKNNLITKIEKENKGIKIDTDNNLNPSYLL